MKQINLVDVSSFNKETMSSVQISEVTGKRHADVMRDIRNIVEQIDEIDKCNYALSFITSELPNGGSKQLPIYILTKKGSLCLASGYNANLRMKIINRWEELELKAQQADIPSYQIENKVQRAEKWIEEQKQLELAEAKLEQVTEVASKNYGNTIAVSKRYTEVINEYKVENENLKDELDYATNESERSKRMALTESNRVKNLKRVVRKNKKENKKLKAELEEYRLQSLGIESRPRKIRRTSSVKKEEDASKKPEFDPSDWKDTYDKGNYC